MSSSFIHVLLVPVQTAFPYQEDVETYIRGHQTQL